MEPSVAACFSYLYFIWVIYCLDLPATSPLTLGKRKVSGGDGAPTPLLLPADQGQLGFFFWGGAIPISVHSECSKQSPASHCAETFLSASEPPRHLPQVSPSRYRPCQHRIPHLLFRRSYLSPSESWTTSLSVQHEAGCQLAKTTPCTRQFSAVDNLKLKLRSHSWD